MFFNHFECKCTDTIWPSKNQNLWNRKRNSENILLNLLPFFLTLLFLLRALACKKVLHNSRLKMKKICSKWCSNNCCIITWNAATFFRGKKILDTILKNLENVEFRLKGKWQDIQMSNFSPFQFKCIPTYLLPLGVFFFWKMVAWLFTFLGPNSLFVPLVNFWMEFLYKGFATIFRHLHILICIQKYIYIYILKDR